MKGKRVMLMAVMAGLLTVSCAGDVIKGGTLGGAPDKPTVLIGEDSVPAPQPPVQELQKRSADGQVAGSSNRQAPQPGAAAAPAGSPAPSEQSQSNDRMVVYNATVSLEVESVGDSVAKIRALVDGTGGMIAGASTRFQGETELATLTIRVPAREYNRVMSELRGMAAKVLSENGSAKDVTEEFTDLGSQLRNFEAAELQYLELLRRANTIDEILKVQAQLNQVRAQIERTRGRINLLQRTSDMATIVVSLTPVGAPAPSKRPQPVWDPAKSVQEAWEQSLRLVGAIADAGLRAVVFSWWMVPIGLVAWGIWSARRRPARGAEAAG